MAIEHFTILTGRCIKESPYIQKFFREFSENINIGCGFGDTFRHLLGFLEENAQLIKNSDKLSLSNETTSYYVVQKSVEDLIRYIGKPENKDAIITYYNDWIDKNLNKEISEKYKIIRAEDESDNTSDDAFYEKLDKLSKLHFPLTKENKMEKHDYTEENISFLKDFKEWVSKQENSSKINEYLIEQAEHIINNFVSLLHDKTPYMVFKEYIRPLLLWPLSDEKNRQMIMDIIEHFGFRNECYNEQSEFVKSCRFEEKTSEEIASDNEMNAKVFTDYKEEHDKIPDMGSAKIAIESINPTSKTIMNSIKITRELDKQDKKKVLAPLLQEFKELSYRISILLEKVTEIINKEEDKL